MVGEMCSILQQVTRYRYRRLVVYLYGGLAVIEFNFFFVTVLHVCFQGFRPANENQPIQDGIHARSRY